MMYRKRLMDIVPSLSTTGCGPVQSTTVEGGDGRRVPASKTVTSLAPSCRRTLDA